MGCFLVLALGVYCYRHHVHRNSHHYIATLPDNHMRMNQLDNDLEEPEHSEDPTSGEDIFTVDDLGKGSREEEGYISS